MPHTASLQGSCLALIALIACGPPAPVQQLGGDDPATPSTPVTNPTPPATNPTPNTQQPAPERREWACRTELGENHPATQRFWRVLGSNDRASRASVITELTRAMEAHPDEEIFALLHGLSHLWVLAEPLPRESWNVASLGWHVHKARESLERAWDLCPGDYRITAWLGPILIRLGRMMRNEGMINEGLEVLQEGIDHYPEFVLFSKLLVYADEEVDSPDFHNAFEAVRDNFSLCGDGREASDDDVRIESNLHDPACSNHFRAAHNVEGSAIFVGDLYVKTGDFGTARRIYEQGLATEDARDWNYRALIEERLADLETFRAEAPHREKTTGRGWIWRSEVQCAVCHQTN